MHVWTESPVGGEHSTLRNCTFMRPPPEHPNRTGRQYECNTMSSADPTSHSHRKSKMALMHTAHAGMRHPTERQHLPWASVTPGDGLAICTSQHVDMSTATRMRLSLIVWVKAC